MDHMACDIMLVMRKRSEAEFKLHKIEVQGQIPG